MTVEEFFSEWWTPKELPQNGFNKTAMLDFAEMYNKEQVKELKSLIQSEVNCCIKKEPLRESSVNRFPTFDEWIEKYFKTPKMKMMYERKDGGGEYDKAELIRKYNKAFGK